ncbi:MAG: hypothetical protein WC100_02370 [Sterolibacterium sp.]
MKIAPKIRIRIMRSWRGYPVGTIISPPGAMRQILLQAKDQLGNKIAEQVDEVIESTIGERPDDSEPGIQVDAQGLAVVADGDESDGQTNNDVRRGPGRPRKGDTK